MSQTDSLRNNVLPSVLRAISLPFLVLMSQAVSLRYKAAVEIQTTRAAFFRNQLRQYLL